MGYTGPERRIHRVLVTRNTENHMRRRICVRVRDRRSGNWVDDHRALGRELAGAFAFGEQGLPVNMTDVPEPGECVFFDNGHGHLITSPVLVVRRPPKALVRAAYIGELGKLALTVLLFVLVFTLVKPLSAAALFAGFIATQLVTLSGLLMGRDQR